MTRLAMVKIEKEYKHVTDDKDRYGNSRYYYRRAGMKKIRLPDIHAPEFEAAYDAAKAAAEKATPSTNAKAPKESLRWLTDRYYLSQEWRLLDPVTQRRLARLYQRAARVNIDQFETRKDAQR